MRVGIDVDGVLTDGFAQEFVAYVSTLKGFEHCTIDKIHPTWSFYKGWPGYTTEQFLEHFHAGVDAGHIFTRGVPAEGAVEATHRLHEMGHSVHIVTDCNMGLSRAGVSQRARVVWLAKHGFYFDSITFSADKTSVPTDIFVDDKVENYIDLMTAHTYCYLLDRPWNQPDHPAWWQPNNLVHTVIGPDRVKSITEFADKVILRGLVSA